MNIKSKTGPLTIAVNGVVDGKTVSAEVSVESSQWEFSLEVGEFAELYLKFPKILEALKKASK